jgi:ABC-type transport system substrate-binding protein
VPASPLNPQVSLGIADGHDDGFGRFFVSSGPYMIEGTPDLDFSVAPGDRVPVSGLVPGQRLALVPNPSWNPLTDALRAAHPGRIELEVVPTPEEAIARVKAGTADIFVNAEVPEEDFNAVRDDATLGRIFIQESGTLLGLTMKTAMPPFDDINVRRAVIHVIDKAAAIGAAGAPLSHRVAHHIAPDSLENNLLLDYRPYGSRDGTSDVDAAKAAMAQSKYDANKDGVCDLAECRDVEAAIGMPELEETVREDLATIGITLVAYEGDLFDAYTEPEEKVAFYVPQGWGRDYLSASNFFVGQFHGPTALAIGGNASLVGATPDQLADWGYDVSEVPNVDARIEACIPVTGAAQFECWAGLDQYMMENVASFIPLGEGVAPTLTSSRVTAYSWDELAVAPSYDRIVLSESHERPPDR